MERKFRVAVAAHDKKKDDLIQFLKDNRHLLDGVEVLAAKTMGQEIQKRTKLKVTNLSNETGRAQSELSAMLSKRTVDAVIYLRESVSLYSYELNIHELNLACDEFEVPMATNIPTARAVLGHLRGIGQASADKNPKFAYDHLVTVMDNFKQAMLEEFRLELQGQTAALKQWQPALKADGLSIEVPVKKLSKEEEMNEILAHLYEEKKANAYVLRKRFGMGYNRAVKIINKLESQNLIGPAGADGNRAVYIKASDFQ